MLKPLGEGRLACVEAVKGIAEDDVIFGRVIRTSVNEEWGQLVLLDENFNCPEE